MARVADAQKKRGRASRVRPAPASGRPRRPSWPFPLLIVLAGLWAYSTSFQGAFVFDDRPAIADNLSIRNWSTVFQPPAGSTVSGRPVANLTLAINYAAGNELFGYHLLNVAIHMAAAVLLFGVVRRSAASARVPEEIRVNASGFACAVAVLWAVHPLTTAAVTYIVQRVESLMALFMLATIYCCIRGDGMERPWRWWTMAMATCALGMATKEVMVVAPVLVWLWFIVFAGAPVNPVRDVRRRLLYAGLAAAWAIFALIILTGTQATAVLHVAVEASRTGTGVTPWAYLLTQAAVILHYLQLAILPSPLAFDYYGWPIAQSPIDVLPQLAVLLVSIAVTLVALARRHPAGFVAASLFLILAPTSSLLPIPTEIAAEHRMYLPLAAVIVLLAAATFLVLRLVASSSVRHTIAMVLVVVCAVALGVQTRARARDYHSEETLWLDTVKKRPHNARARINYGITLMKSARYAEAEAQMRTARDLPADPETRAQVHLQLGAALCAQGKCREGLPELEAALRLDPDVDDADPVLGQAFSDVGDMRRAFFYLRRAATKDPDNVALLSRLAWLLATTRDVALSAPDEAIRYGERAAALTGRRNAAVLEALAAAYARATRFEDAARTAAEAEQRALADGNPSVAAALRQQGEGYRRAAAGGR